jgi:mono/diheme cytochrome c family protein
MRLSLITIICIGLAGVAYAVQIGDPDAGATYAKDVCAQCHAVLPNEQLSPLPGAPSFQNVAETPGMTSTALAVWLQTSHPTMPNIILAPEELENVIAYILSLKRQE